MFQSIQDSTAIQPQKENKEEDFEVEEDIPEEDNNKENENEDSDLELDDDELDYELANLQEEKFYDCNEEGRLQQLQEMQQIQQEEPKVESKHKASSEEQELIDEQIEEIISDPQTKPEQVAQIIQNEENLIDDIGPLELENKQDHQVNEYYKKHDDPKNEE